jgi:hypothetical protein
MRAAGRMKLAFSALAAVLGLGLAVLPVAANAAVSSPASSAARGTAAARQAAAAASQLGNPKPGSAKAALARLAERARLAAAGRHPGVKATGTITGSVLGFNAQPIAGACVTAVRSSVSVTATAAPDGTFALAGLAPGNYALEYRDCAAAAKYVPAWSGGVAWRSAAAQVRVAANQTRHVPVMILKPWQVESVLAGTAQFQQGLTAASGRGLSAAAAATTGRISGLVTGNGKPLRGICVLAFPVSRGRVYGATTAKNGTYAVRYMRPGRYYVAFAGFGCPGSANWLPQAYPDINLVFGGFGLGTTPKPVAVTVTSGHATRGIDAHLRLGGEISGTVTGPAGRKLGGVCVVAIGTVAGGQFGFSAATSANGTYAVHALLPGKYSLQFGIGCGVGGNYAPATHRPVKIGYGTKVSGVNEVLRPGASVTGKVTLGTSSGKPLAGMCVYASNADGSISVQTQTGPHGNYRVIGLGGGTYQLQISPGCPNNGNYTNVTLSAHTTAGQQTSGVNAVLLPGATIAGTVTDRKGRPVPGICTEVDQSAPSQSAGSSFVNATASDGSYVVNQLDAGTYEVGFYVGCGNSANYAPYWYDNQTDPSLATPIALATGASKTVNAKLQPGAAIAGTVTDASGHGLAGISVCAESESASQLGASIGQAQTGTHGRYTISGLPPGQYLVDFGCGQSTRYAEQWFDGAGSPGSADAVSAPAGRTAGINADLRLAGSISGVVTGTSGKPLAGVCVSAISTNGSGSQLGFFAFGSSSQPTTDSHGAYRVSGLTAGSYDILFQPCYGTSRYAQQWYRRHGSASFQTAVRVRAGKQTSGIDARLSIGGSISGHAFGGTGKPLSNICVIALDPVTSYSGGATTGRSGAYTIPGLPTGTYTMEFLPCANQNLIPALGQAKVSAPHAVTGVNATLRPGGSISGIVTAAGSGSPVANSCVEIVSSDPNNLGGFASTNPDGSYLATGLPAGTYQVYFGDPTCFFSPAGFVPQWYNNQPTQATANPVTVTVGHTTPSIDAVLQSGAQAGQISGTVSGPTSAPLAGICVTAVPYSADLLGSPRVVAVSGSGDYELLDLTPGQYKVEFSAGCGASGYKAQWWQNVSSQSAATPVPVLAGKVSSGISAKMST